MAKKEGAKQAWGWQPDTQGQALESLRLERGAKKEGAVCLPSTKALTYIAVWKGHGDHPRPCFGGLEALGAR